VKTIHAKIKNRRKDALHKYSRAVVNDAGAVFVGNISSTWPVASGNGKAALDVSWSMLKNFLRYKCDHAGVVFCRSERGLHHPDLLVLPRAQRAARSRRSGYQAMDLQRMPSEPMIATATPPSTSPVSEARRSVFIDREAPAFRQGRLHLATPAPRESGPDRNLDLPGCLPCVDGSRPGDLALLPGLRRTKNVRSFCSGQSGQCSSSTVIGNRAVRPKLSRCVPG